MTNDTCITEVLPEPGTFQIWVTFGGTHSHRLDLSPLLSRAPFQVLNLRRVFSRVSITADGRHVRWPGGAQLDARSVLQAPHGTFPVLPLAVVPASQRYRPLLPYLRHLLPAVYLKPAPIEMVVVQRLLGLHEPELRTLLSGTPIPQEPVLNRLYDLAMFLCEHFSEPHVHAMVRRPWPFALRECPSEPMLHTLIGCLQHQRPDLIERPCMLLATGGR